MEKTTTRPGFTPGSWKQVGYGYPRRPVHALDGAIKWCVANVNGRTPEEVAANARLIAAAPEMYDALRGAVAGLETYDGWDDVLASWRAVLAKVEGV